MNIGSRKKERTMDLIDRKEELARIQDMMKGAESGKGGMVLIKGEAGIGKTRLIDEVARRAKERGYSIYRGACLHYRRFPLFPFTEMIRDIYDIRNVPISDDIRASLEKRIKKVLGTETLQIRELLKLIEPVNDPLGAYRFDLADKVSLIKQIPPMGMEAISIGKQGSQQNFIPDEKDIKSVELGEGKESLDPKNVQLLIDTLEGFFESNPYGMAILHSFDELAKVNTRKEMKRFIKNMDEISRKNSGAILFGSVDPEDGLLKELSAYEPFKDDKRTSDITGSDPDEIMGSPNRMISSIFNSLSEDNKSLIILENLQWGDKSTLNLLHYLARDAADRNMFIIGSYRSEELNLEADGEEQVPLRDSLQRMTREHLFSTLELERFDRKKTSEMVECLIGEKPRRSLVDDVMKETDGNPLFVIGYFSSGLHGFFPGMVLDNILPDQKTMITIRLRSLDENVREALELASVMKDDITIEGLSRILGMEQDKVLDIIDDLMVLKFLKESNEGFIFEHGKVRKVIYEMMDEERKKDLHRKIARTLYGKGFEDDPAMMSRASEHYLIGGEEKKALDLILALSEKHRDDIPAEVLLVHLNKALECMGDLEGGMDRLDDRVSILQEKGDIEERCGMLKEAMGSYLEAVQIAETTGISHDLARSYRKIGDMKLRMFQWDQTIDFYLRSLNISKKEKKHIEISKAFKGLGNIYFYKGDYSRSIECYLKYMDYPENLKVSDQLDSMIGMGDIYYQMGDFNQSLTYFKLAIRKCDEGKLVPSIILAHMKMAKVLLRLGEVEDSIRFAEDAYSRIGNISNRHDFQQILIYYVDLMIEVGEMEKAQEGIDQLEDTVWGISDLLLETQWHRIVGIFLSKQRNFKGSIYHMTKALEILEKIDIPFHTALTYFHFGLIRFQQMDVDGALEMLIKANTIFKRIKALHYISRSSSKLREVGFIKEGLRG